jgi:hypothetical protein
MCFPSGRLLLNFVVLPFSLTEVNRKLAGLGR